MVENLPLNLILIVQAHSHNILEPIQAEAVAHRCFVKQMFLEISQISQEIT